MKFARCGGLSPVEYKAGGVRKKRIEIGDDGMSRTVTGTWAAEGFHAPPARRGIYAFIYPYIEPFLVCWKLPEGEKPTFRVFDYEGELWCHFTEEGASMVRGSWSRVHTAALKKMLAEVKKHDRHSLLKDDLFGRGPIIDPYKRGQNGFMSRDHLEVFIEAKNLGKIR